MSATPQLSPVAQNKLNTVRDLFLSCQKQIAAALPRHMTAERMARIAFSAAQRNPILLECTPQSLALSVINASELGCEPGLSGESYLVPYKNTKKGVYECQLIVGFKGMMKLARNSGMVKSFRVGVVREGDKFHYQRGANQDIDHRPADDNEDSPITHVWAGAMVEGEFEFEVMTIGQINKIKARSRSANNGPWVTDYEEMCKKTVLRRFCKMLPQSPELAKAVSLDEQAEAGLPQASEIVDLGAAEEVDPNTTGAGAAIEQKLADKGKKTAQPPVEAESTVIPEFGDTNAIAALPKAQAEIYEAEFNKARSEGGEPQDAHMTAWIIATGEGA